MAVTPSVSYLDLMCLSWHVVVVWRVYLSALCVCVCVRAGVRACVHVYLMITVPVHVRFYSCCIYGGADRRAQVQTVKAGVEIVVGR